MIRSKPPLPHVLPARGVNPEEWPVLVLESFDVGALVDHSGTSYGHNLVLGLVGRHPENGHTCWLCRCPRCESHNVLQINTLRTRENRGGVGCASCSTRKSARGRLAAPIISQSEIMARLAEWRGDANGTP